MLSKKYILATVLIFLSIKIQAQSDAQVVLEYKSGNFPSKLPYGTNFIIKGPPVSPESGDTAMRIQLKVYEKDKDEDVYYKYTWESKKKESIFEIPVSKVLYPGTAYTFKFNFFVKSQIDDNVAITVFDSVKLKVLVRVIEKHSISGEDTKLIVENALNEVGKQYKQYYYLKGDTIKPGLKLDNTEQWEVAVMQSSNYVSTLITIKADAQQSFKDLKSYIAGKDTATLSSSEKNCIETINRAVDYTEIDSNLYNCLLTTTGFDDVNSEIDNILSKKASIDQFSRLLKQTQGITTDKEKKLKQTQLLKIETVNINTDSTIAETNNASKERLGLRYGLAYSPIGWDENLLFQFVTTRFYILPLDKSMDKPFKQFWELNRLAINLGMIIGDIKYKGEKLQDVENLGLKLLTGVSYDFSKNLSLSTGFIWFDYNEGNPFYEKRKTKASFYVGLSFDFNLIETLKK